jgi:hypothetical protein
MAWMLRAVVEGWQRLDRRYPWIVETARKIRKTQFILAVVLGVDGMAVRNLCRERHQ